MTKPSWLENYPADFLEYLDRRPRLKEACIADKVIIRDIFDLYEATTKDKLTELYNESFFRDSLAREMSRYGRRTGIAGSMPNDRRTERSGRRKPDHGILTVTYYDLDGFKAVNDRLGHDQADKILVGTGAALRESYRDSDIVSRFHGDEFVVMMPESSIDLAAIKAESFSREIPQMFPVSVSYGIAGSDETVTGYEIIKLADSRLRKSKQVKGASR